MAVDAALQAVAMEHRLESSGMHRLSLARPITHETIGEGSTGEPTVIEIETSGTGAHHLADAPPRSGTPETSL
jgi:hypothetical protein